VNMMRLSDDGVVYRIEDIDRASREGYIGTERYVNELNELREQDISLRDEIGDEYYDNYLYTSGQSNRIRVASVMIGSPAEQAGMQNGDMILVKGSRGMAMEPEPSIRWSTLRPVIRGASSRISPSSQ